MSTRQAFRFGLGHVTLEFLATLAGRFGEPTERLATPRDLSRWLDEAGLASSARCDERLLLEARQLREAGYRLVRSASRGEPPERADVSLINAWARHPVAAPQIGARLARSSVGPEPAEAAVAQLARASVELITGPDVGRIRACAAPDCSLLFIDRSRPGRRRWCSMERCGNRSKTARYREHKRKEAGGRDDR